MSEINLTGVPQFDKVEVVKTGEITVTKAANDTVGFEILNHNLGFVPFSIVYVTPSTLSSQTILHPYIQSGVSGGGVGLILEFTRVFITDTTIEFDYVSPNTGTAGSQYANEVITVFKYFLCRYAAN